MLHGSFTVPDNFKDSVGVADLSKIQIKIAALGIVLRCAVYEYSSDFFSYPFIKGSDCNIFIERKAVFK